jgi:hypothetical protein
MGYTYNKSSKDDNHNEIDQALRDNGVVTFDVTPVKEFCDIVACYNGVVYLLEVKDGSKPPSQRRLTPRELKAVKRVNSVGCQIYVVNNIKEAVDLVCG